MSEILKDLLLSKFTSLGCVRVVKDEISHEKEDIIMTDTQVRYATNVENIRHNQMVEEENRRHNFQTEDVANRQLAEAMRANRAQEANARYAADQSLAGNVAKAEATKNTAATNERIARMQTTANAVQKSEDRKLTAEQKAADRALSSQLADATNAIKSRQNDISQLMADLQAVKNDREYETALKKLGQSAEEIKIKWGQLKDTQKNTNHKIRSDWFNNINNAVNGAVKSADTFVGTIDKVRNMGRDQFNPSQMITDFNTLVRAWDTLDRMQRRNNHG